MLETFTIGEMAAKLQVSVPTMRYYDEQGLLPFVKRNESGQRIFTEDDLGYIEVIECLKKSAIPIKDIATFMQWCVKGDSTLPQRKQFMDEEEAKLEQKIAELQLNLAFLRWKKWYYQKANEAGTEAIFFLPGTRQVDPKWRKLYLAQNQAE